MDAQFAFSALQLLDLMLRFSTAGVLLLLVLLLLGDRQRRQRLETLWLIACVLGYVLLTAPIADEHYGWLRPPLLLLTDSTTYALLAVYWRRVHGSSLVSVLPVWARVLVAAWFAWLAWFFLVLGGRGAFHDWHHGISLLVLLVIVIDAARDLGDDLVESRRDVRKWAIGFISLYMLALTVVEVFFQPLKDAPMFSLLNALTILLACAFLSYRALLSASHTGQQNKAATAASKKPTSARVETPGLQAQTLLAAMEQGLYAENGLTIARLAERLNIPEHQLRAVINQELGFDNFSKFLASYRIPAVCEQMQKPQHQNTPILTLALDAGFNSIATFNRAFKTQLGVTPTQYRQEITAHFRK